MKTDRFSDIIRRKLESIRPEFSEKDWTRMQKSLQTGMPQPATPTTLQPFGRSLWTAKPWLMAAAAVSAVVMVTFGFWQQREINQLRETVSQLKKPLKRPSGQSRATVPETGISAKTPTTGGAINPETTLPTSENHAGAVLQQPHDTVYITRYVAVPSKSHLVPPNEDYPTDQPATVADQRYAKTNDSQKTVAQPNQSDNLPINPKTDAYGEPSTPSKTTETLKTKPSASSKSSNWVTRERKQKGQYLTNQEKAFSPERTSRSTYGRNNTANPGAGAGLNQNEYTDAPGGSTPAESAKALVSAGFEPVTSLPLSLPNTNWSGMLAQRAKRIRPARTTAVGGTEPAQAPESQRVARVGSHFRVGLGGELVPKLASAGAFSELLIGKRWAISAGLTQATYTGEKFISDFDFDVRMRRNFRKEFARNIDPRRDIFNIDTRTTRWQVPISINYRIPLGRTVTFSPSIGTYLNVSSTEKATFYCPVPIPQRGFEELSYSDKQTAPLINTIVLGAGIEWQQGHWVLQGSPILTLPIQNDTESYQPNQNWQSSTLLGLRARLLYQF